MTGLGIYDCFRLDSFFFSYVATKIKLLVIM